MTAATVTEVPGAYLPGIKIGTISAGNNYTTTFGFTEVEWCMVSSNSDDDAIVSAAISSGDVTLGVVDDAGSAITSAITINFMAKGR